MLNPSQALEALDRFWREAFERAKIQPVRTLREFAEQEIIIPKGPFKGRRFSCKRQPYAGLWFDLVDSGRWNRFFATGPVQSGKTLVAFVIPTVHTLFELEENAINGIPDGNMIADKWLDDILPVIEETKYSRFLPSSGASSRGGDKVMGIRFKNGSVLRFMTAGGSDKSRAGFTARDVIATEVDGFDIKSEKSREGDKFSQLEDRNQAYGSRRRTFGECTVSIKSGRTWREFENGTRTRIIRPCPHCKAWVTPEREHLVGWKDASDVHEAAEKAFLHCPECGEAWSEEERYEANLQSKVIHRGQELTPEGEIVGEPAKTDTLSFRWTAVDNHFVTMAEVAKKEWNALYGADSKTPEEAETTLRQKVWVIPPEENGDENDHLDEHEIMRRTGATKRGVVPAWATRLTVGVDVGKRIIHYVVVAWGQHATSRIIEYGRRDVASDDIQIDRAVELSLLDLCDDLSNGFPDEEDGREYPSMGWIDSGYVTLGVYKGSETASKRTKSHWNEKGITVLADKRVWWPSKGFGESAEGKAAFRKHKAVGGNVLKLGDGSYLANVPHEGVTYQLFHGDADYWKTWFHDRLRTPVDEPSAMTLFKSEDRFEHTTLAKHLTAEKSTREFVTGKGYVEKWVRVNRNNHYLDCAWLACAAAHWVGVRLTDESPSVSVRPASEPPKERQGRWSGIRRRGG
jgi:phage terminase large subunit GpA-like protein